jgi:hypothetical protein
LSLIIRCLFLLISFVFVSRTNAQILFSENFEGVLNNATNLPVNWQETGNSLDGIYSVGDSIQANYLLNLSSLWKVPSHGKFVMTNDVRCSYEKGIGFCDKSKDRLVFPIQSFPTFSGSLILKFDAFFTGKLGSLATVEVSLDGGTNWVKEYEFVSNEIKWQSNSVNLSKYIGESNVLISFLYNDNNLVRDGLAIDNVIIKKQVPWKDVSVDYVDAAKFSSIPITQVDSIPLKMTFHNGGTLTIDTVTTFVQVIETSNPQTILFSGHKKVSNLHSNDSITLNLGKFLPIKKNTTYLIKHWVKTTNDTVVDNDSLNIPIQITQSKYARDYVSSTSNFDLTSTNTITLGNIYTITRSSYLDSVYFETASGSIGTNVQAYVFPIVNGKVSLNELGKSDIYTLSNPSQSIYLKIKSNSFGKVLLDTGSYLIALQKLNGGGSMGIKLCDNYYENNTVFMRIGNVSFQTLDSYFSGTKKTVPIIRAFLTPYCRLSTKINTINTKCKFSTGSLTAIPINGKSPYTYLWNNNVTDSVIANLGLGKYSVKIKDYYDCVFDSTNISLDPFNNPIIGIDSLKHPLCFDDASGFISITTNNPAIITKVKWNGVATNQLFIENAKAGVFKIDVVDGNNCEDSIKVTLINPDSLGVSYLVKDETIKSKGIISLFVNGGNPPYSFSWGDTIKVKNRTELIGDSLYTVTISDTNGCKKIKQIYVGSTVGINENIYESSVIYPNPFNSQLFIESETPISSITLMDLTGKICINTNVDSTISSPYFVDVDDLEQGVYIVTIEHFGEKEQFKITKN